MGDSPAAYWFRCAEDARQLVRALKSREAKSRMALIARAYDRLGPPRGRKGSAQALATPFKPAPVRATPS